MNGYKRIVVCIMAKVEIKHDACSGVHSSYREENRHKVGIYVQLPQLHRNMKSGYSRIFNVTRAITTHLTIVKSGKNYALKIGG